MSVGIPSGQVFGFLGINGAGKTTTMKMLTGQLLPSLGNAVINGCDIVRNLQSARKCIGYCPQFDPILEAMTARHHLRMFGRLKGFSGRSLDTVVESMLQKTG